MVRRQSIALPIVAQAAFIRAISSLTSTSVIWPRGANVAMRVPASWDRGNWLARWRSEMWPNHKLKSSFLCSSWRAWRFCVRITCGHMPEVRYPGTPDPTDGWAGWSRLSSNSVISSYAAGQFTLGLNLDSLGTLNGHFWDQNWESKAIEWGDFEGYCCDNCRLPWSDPDPK